MKHLVDQYQPVLKSFFMRRSRNIWDAEELTQEVFCKILNRRDVAYTDYNAPYIFTIAWSVLRDRSRRESVRHRDMHVSYEESFVQEDTISPELELNGEELYGRFLQVLNRLSPRVRQVFILSRYEGLSYPEIAEQCEISVSAVEKHIMKALQQMKEIV